MKCLDHIDMAVMAGMVATVASAVFLVAYLGVERGPLAAPQRDGWLEQLTGFVLVQQGAAFVKGEPEMFGVCLDQLTFVRSP